MPCGCNDSDTPLAKLGLHCYNIDKVIIKILSFSLLHLLVVSLWFGLVLMIFLIVGDKFTIQGCKES